MPVHRFSISPLCDRALTIDFGNVIDEEVNDCVLEAAGRLESNPFAGFLESVPAYSSLSIFYDVHTVRSAFPEFSTAYDAACSFMQGQLSAYGDSPQREPRRIEIPVDFSSEFALDLEFVAKTHGLSPTDTIGIFTSVEYRVYMIGFLPGFPYMGKVDGRIATGRRTTPRLNVPRGSIGIAGEQTGIYPLDSPGGWQIIGRADVELFSTGKDEFCLLGPGDRIRFVDRNLNE